MKPKYLYHGSPRKIKGGYFIPRAPPEIDPNNPENNQKAVYATSFKEQAIRMSICRGDGVKDASMGVGKKDGKFFIRFCIILEGWPKHKEGYVYVLPSKTFKNEPKGSSQWVSTEKVKPIKIEKIIIKDHLSMIRKANKKEKAHAAKIQKQREKMK